MPWSCHLGKLQEDTWSRQCMKLVRDFGDGTADTERERERDGEGEGEGERERERESEREIKKNNKTNRTLHLEEFSLQPQEQPNAKGSSTHSRGQCPG